MPIGIFPNPELGRIAKKLKTSTESLIRLCQQYLFVVGCIRARFKRIRLISMLPFAAPLIHTEFTWTVSRARITFGLCFTALIACQVAIAGEIGVNRSAGNAVGTLEEVVVAAQKRDQLMQEVPIAISVLNSDQLKSLGVYSLGDLGGGAIPSLRINSMGNTPSNLVVAIRGNAPNDATEVTRETSVAVYLDNIYLGRSHGLGMELVDLERIEVLRGPQGTLFGRNAIGGAVNLIAKKPSGEFGFGQTVGVGRFDEFRSLTRVNFPAIAGVSAKLDYLHSERDGWVDNTAPGQADFNQFEKDGARASLRWQAGPDITVDYSYDWSDIETAQNYFQLYVDRVGLIGEERDRRTQTRYPITPLKPTLVEQQGHALTLEWQLAHNLSFKSLSAYRELEEEGNNNYGGVVYFNGLIDASIVDQHQFSQELQLIGTQDTVEWITGLYYFNEDASKKLQNSFSLDMFGALGPAFAPIDPPTTLDLFGLYPNALVPSRELDNEAESRAVFGQLSWTPLAFERLLTITAGIRYTEDERSGFRIDRDDVDTIRHDFSLDSDHTDYLIALDYQWTDDISSYIKWSTAYKAGGANSRSSNMTPYAEEEAKTIELGIKSEFWQQRGRLNIAVFDTDYEGMQLDFNTLTNIIIAETINAQNTVEVSGAELDLSLIAARGLSLTASYSYLDGHMPLQPNPFANGALKQFFVPRAPRHAGAFALDYQFKPMTIGSLAAHLDMTSTDHYTYVLSGERRKDSYTLFNARVTLSEFFDPEHIGELELSLWAKNITDEEYIIIAFPVGDPALTIAQAFGDPRTFGIEVKLSL